MFKIFRRQVLSVHSRPQINRVFLPGCSSLRRRPCRDILDARNLNNSAAFVCKEVTNL